VWRYRATATVYAPAAEVAAKLPRWVVVEAIDDRRCLAHIGSDNPEMLALWLGALGADFEVSDAPELVESLHIVAHRYLRAVSADHGPGRPLRQVVAMAPAKRAPTARRRLRNR